MIRLIDKNHFFSLERIWFPENTNMVKSKCDIVRYYRFRNGEIELRNSIKDTNYTLITNLHDSEDQILAKATKTFRYEIKRSFNEEIIIKNYLSLDIKDNPNLLDDFKNTYMHFCDKCNNEELKKVYREANIQSYIDNDCILISCAYYKCGKVYHLYIWDKSDAILIHSASDFRNENVDKTLAGRANKLLHYKDILYFKDKKLSNYDWGNVSSFDNPNGIDKFKMSFGGERVIVNSFFIGNSALGKILVRLKLIKEKLKKTEKNQS